MDISICEWLPQWKEVDLTRQRGAVHVRPVGVWGGGGGGGWAVGHAYVHVRE